MVKCQRFKQWKMLALFYFPDLPHNSIQSNWLHPPSNCNTNYVSKGPLKCNLHEDGIYVHTYHFFESSLNLTCIKQCFWYSKHSWSYYHCSFPFRISSHIFLLGVAVICFSDRNNTEPSTPIRLVVNARIHICSRLFLPVFVP